jgi:GMP synthase-like glutamine amidotransferase
MKKALVIQHMKHDHAGRFAAYFAEASIMPHRVFTFAGQDIPPLKDFDMMLVLGGAQNTWQEEDFPYLRMEKEVIREWVSQRAKPYFGICLGHQLLADALGGAVGTAADGEVGVFDVQVEGGEGLLSGWPTQVPVMQWHQAEVKTVPPGMQVLAASARTAVQALQLGDHAFSTQFHCEFTPETILSWSAVPSYVETLEAELGPGAYENLIAKSWPHMPEMEKHTRLLWDNFRRLAGV